MLYYPVDESDRLTGFAVCFSTVHADFKVSGEDYTPRSFSDVTSVIGCPYKLYWNPMFLFP